MDQFSTMHSVFDVKVSEKLSTKKTRRTISMEPKGERGAKGTSGDIGERGFRGSLGER